MTVGPKRIARAVARSVAQRLIRDFPCKGRHHVVTPLLLSFTAHLMRLVAPPSINHANPLHILCLKLHRTLLTLTRTLRPDGCAWVPSAVANDEGTMLCRLGSRAPRDGASAGGRLWPLRQSWRSRVAATSSGASSGSVGQRHLRAAVVVPLDVDRPAGDPEVGVGLAQGLHHRRPQRPAPSPTAPRPTPPNPTAGPRSGRCSRAASPPGRSSARSSSPTTRTCTCSSPTTSATSTAPTCPSGTSRAASARASRRSCVTRRPTCSKRSWSTRSRAGTSTS